MRMLAALALAFSLGASALPADAATIHVNPTNFAALIPTAAGGDTIVFDAGTYPIVRVYNFNPSSMVTFDLSAATINQLPCQNSSNLEFKSGASAASAGPALGPAQFGILTGISCSHVVVHHMKFSHAGTVSVGWRTSTDVRIDDVDIGFTSGDGVDFASVTNSSVTNSVCHDNIRTTIHPDCVQMWNILGQQTTAYILLQNNLAEGDTQGFDSFDHGTTGPGVHHITLDSNTVCSTYSAAGFLNNTHDSVMTNNHAYTLVGTPLGYSGAHYTLSGDMSENTQSPPINGNVYSGNVNGNRPLTNADYQTCPAPGGGSINTLPPVITPLSPLVPHPLLNGSATQPKLGGSSS